MGIPRPDPGPWKLYKNEDNTFVRCDIDDEDAEKYILALKNVENVQGVKYAVEWYGIRRTQSKTESSIGFMYLQRDGEDDPPLQVDKTLPQEEIEAYLLEYHMTLYEKKTSFFLFTKEHSSGKVTYEFNSRYINSSSKISGSYEFEQENLSWKKVK